MKATKQAIEAFFAQKTIAIAGVSRNPKKFGHQIFSELKKKHHLVVPINPNVQEIDGIQCFPSVTAIPPDIQSLLIVTPKSQTDALLLEAIEKGIANIWVQQSSETQETIQIASKHNNNIILKQCAFMFTNPVSGIHKFHRSILKLFGRLPG